MSRVLMMGPPGVGKGTQSARLAIALGVPAISTGDIFRDHVRRRTPVGVELERIIAAGDYVPDATTNEIVAMRLREADAASGFILDGFPRTTQQVEELDGLLAASRAVIDAVVLLTANTTTLIERMTLRAADASRTDDTPDTIAHRIAVYEQSTARLVTSYDDRGCVHRIDGLGTPDEVTTRITAALGAVV